MADSASESETDGAGSGSAALTPSSSKEGIVISPFRLEELTNRLASLQQENKVLKIELETYKLKCKALQEENRELRKASVTIRSLPELSAVSTTIPFLPASNTAAPHTRSATMADSASESDTDAAGSGSAALQSASSKAGIIISPFRLEELTNRLASLQQENKVLKIELETYKLKCKALQEENRELRKASVTIQARAEQEEEFISNTLFKKIQALQKEKETLAVNYEKEEEFLTNELSRKLMQLQHEKAELEQHLEQEQEFQVNKLMKKIKKLENDTISKQLTLEQFITVLYPLKNKLGVGCKKPSFFFLQLRHTENRAQYIEEERHMREENIRLQRKLQREMERREALCRQLSESESSLEMDDERYFNEMSAQGLRPRTVSSPIPYTPSPSSSRPISPGMNDNIYYNRLYLGITRSLLSSYQIRDCLILCTGTFSHNDYLCHPTVI
ncbi:UNVERIFIED_CONTAM: hypothetical protein FKN15_044249 [Acipenser sinensis]